MNELVALNRTNKYAAAKKKKEETELVAWMCKEQNLKVFKKPIKLKCYWIYERTNQDPDNIRSQIKVILDGFVLSGIIPDDSVKTIKGFDGDEYIKKTKNNIKTVRYNIIEMYEIDF